MLLVSVAFVAPVLPVECATNPENVAATLIIRTIARATPEQHAQVVARVEAGERQRGGAAKPRLGIPTVGDDRAR